ncbi:hypothetical protein [Streptomyces sp. NPDC055109]
MLYIPNARRVQSADISDLAAILARAFSCDPVWLWLFPAAVADRESRMVFTFKWHLEYHASRGYAWTDSDRCAAAFWIPPGKWKTPFPHMMQNRKILTSLFEERVPAVADRFRQAERFHPGLPQHWHLEYIGADAKRLEARSDHLLINSLLRQADDSQFPTYFESSNPQKLNFYESNGFIQGADLTFRSGPPVSKMWRHLYRSDLSAVYT